MSENRVDQPDAKSEDRRSQRSENALINALIDLMAAKTYDSISIKEIVDKANVGRSTFYSHYQTKDDLLKSGFERLLDELLNHVVLSKDNLELSVDATMLFQHAQGHYHLFKVLMWGSGYKILTMDEHIILAGKLQQRLSQFFPDESKISVPLNVLSISLSGNLLILLKWWLDNKMPYSPEKMNELFQILVLPGVNSALKEKAQ
ncbi:MAG: TetR/AcrR family transcriptional regulator [Anaerolineaceae bacterium]